MRCWHGSVSGARCKWFAYGPADATATPSSLDLLKSRIVLPLWCQLTQLVLEKRPLSGCLSVSMHCCYGLCFTFFCLWQHSTCCYDCLTWFLLTTNRKWCNACQIAVLLMTLSNLSIIWGKIKDTYLIFPAYPKLWTSLKIQDTKTRQKIAIWAPSLNFVGLYVRN